MKKWLLMAVFAFVPMVVGATDWRQVASSDNVIMYVDFDTVATADVNVLEAKPKTYLTMTTKLQYLPHTKEAKKNIDHLLGQYYITCDNHSFLNAYIEYKKDGSVSDLWNNRKSMLNTADFLYNFPTTIMGGAIQATCKYHKTGEKPLSERRFLSKEEVERLLPQLHKK